MRVLNESLLTDRADLISCCGLGMFAYVLLLLLAVASDAVRLTVLSVPNPTNQTIFTSTDGAATFTPLAASALLPMAGYAVVYGQGKWVAVGQGPTSSIAWSGDGVIYTPSSFGLLLGRGVTYSEELGIFVAVGSVPSIAWSNDGVTWTGLGSRPFLNSGFGVAYGQRKFVAFGHANPNPIAYSSDGKVWTEIASSASIFLYGMGGVYAQTLDRWVAGGIDGGVGNTLAYSPDGISWTGLGSNIFTGACNSVAFSVSQSRFVAVGNGARNVVAYSSDGVLWTGLGSILFSTGTSGGWGVIYSEQLGNWACVGDGIIIPNVAYGISSDGVTWQPFGNGYFQKGIGIASDEAGVVVRASLTFASGVQQLLSDVAFLANTSFVIPPLSLLNVTGNVTILANVFVNLTGATSGTFVVMSARSISGTFRGAEATDACGAPAVATLTQTTTTVLVTVTATNACSITSVPMPVAEIVGISVGAVIVGALGGIVIVLLSRHIIRNHEQTMKKHLVHESLNEVPYRSF